MKGWRLKLKREPDPVLTEDEVDFLANLLDEKISEWDALMRRQKVSESVIRARMDAVSIRKKIDIVIEHR